MLPRHARPRVASPRSTPCSRSLSACPYFQQPPCPWSQIGHWPTDASRGLSASLDASKISSYAAYASWYSCRAAASRASSRPATRHAVINDGTAVSLRTSRGGGDGLGGRAEPSDEGPAASCVLDSAAATSLTGSSAPSIGCGGGGAAGCRHSQKARLTCEASDVVEPSMTAGRLMMTMAGCTSGQPS